MVAHAGSKGLYDIPLQLSVQLEVMMVNSLYYPGPSDGTAFAEAIRIFVEKGWVARNDCHYGYGGSLHQVDVHSRLFLLCHGHGELPLFETEPGQLWWPREMAFRLLTDGLSLQHRNIEMFVCHAGDSITSLTAAAERIAVYEKFLAASSTREEKALAKKFDKLVKQGPGPGDFTASSSYNRVIPLCAQFVQELKKLKYNFIQVTAYKAPVHYNQVGNTNEPLLIITKNGGIRPAEKQEIVVWQ